MNVSKRVLIFSLAYEPYVGGAEVAIKEITNRIRVEEVEFHLVTLRFNSALPAQERIGNVLVHRIGWGTKNPSMQDLQKFPLKLLKYWYQFAAAFAALRLHRTYHFSAVWAMMAHASGIPAGIFKTIHPEVKYLLTLQEGDPPEHIERLARPVWPLFRRAFTKADALQAISTFLMNWGVRMGFKGEACVIPNAVDTKRFLTVSLTEQERDVIRAKQGVHPGATVLVTTSRLVQKNAVDDVIRALELLPGEVHFVIYGIGPEESKLRNLVEQRRLQSRVHFAGEITQADLPRALAACTIFVRPSRSEGMGISFIEAMATGLPVVATQVGGISDFLFDAKRNPEKQATGWAVDANAPAQIADAVKEIMAHPEKVKAVTETARKMVIEKYDWTLVARQMLQLFERL